MVVIVAGVGVTLWLNLDAGAGKREALADSTTAPPPSSNADPLDSARRPAPPFREEIIGEAIREEEALEIAAVYFPAVAMEGMDLPVSDHALHLEADVRATGSNPNGFALGQFIPYMRVGYTIRPEAGGETLVGELLPMVARDGLHYGATIVLPGPGNYRLTYSVAPPSHGGLGRHSDPVTGVGPWWKPFEVSWDWSYAPRQAPQ